MNTKKKVKVVLLGILALAVLIGAFQLYNYLQGKYGPQSAVTSQSGEPIPAPDFAVTDSEGNQVSLYDFAGEPVIINFSTSWCPHCISEKPIFQEYYDKYGDKVNLLMVDLVGNRETVEDGKAFIAKNGYTYPAYYDISQEAAVAYGINAFPATFFINEDMEIVYNYYGGMNKALFETFLKLYYNIGPQAETDN
ncbi:MAG TPA: redoxin domain-containing protein [Anaerovoracaceae bacterium]|nr:redoxin domain-containing protein [Anaerovoracaceae bacterium]